MPSIIGCFVVAVALLCGCGAADHPDFSGEWHLDSSQSTFGPWESPHASIHRIRHQGSHFKVSIWSLGPQGERNSEYEFPIDGSEMIVAADGVSARTKTYWEGDLLVTEWQMDVDGEPTQMKDLRALSRDGQTLTIERQVRSDWADWDQKTVLVRYVAKQPGRVARFPQPTLVGPVSRFPSDLT